MEDLSKSLIEQVRLGRSVLFLGAGATLGASGPDERTVPTAAELRDRIGEHFLTQWDRSDDSLAWVSELAVAGSDLFTVQDFIADQFRLLEPAPFHLLIPTFRWRGIATTNYDKVIEDVYDQVSSPVQNVVPFLSNNDGVDEQLRDPSSVALLKLHGCISRTRDRELPLILSVDQYVRYREGRSRLFHMLEEWASENTIVFIGHSLQDHDLRVLLLELSNNVASRPRFYLVRPGVSKEERDFWASKSISVLDGTFEEFLTELDSTIAKSFRGLVARLNVDHPILTRFVVNAPPSVSLIESLANDFEYVQEGLPLETGAPSQFYAGFGLGWYPVVNNLDVRRSLTNKIIEDMVLRLEEDRPSSNELYVIKAEAGAGKSVLLRRVAWEAAVEAGVLCLFTKSFSSPDYEVLAELSRCADERIFLFVDDASDHLGFILDVIRFARSKKLRITIITTERINEWNMHCESLEEYLTSEYRLPYLSKQEIGKLVDLLDTHASLGPALEKKSHEERIEEFHERAGRQLLVALHEASHGEPYEEILLDEYDSLIPDEAKRLYLSVCVLYRLNVPVRAGLISRVHEIPFEHFKERLMRPLEHVIHVTKLPWGDIAYICRHPEIAQIIFERVLTDATEKFNEYIRIVKGLNPIYSVDYDALRKLMRARTVHELFPNYEDARAIYEIIKGVVKNDAYFIQQRANYERIRPSGNLALAQSLLLEARELAPHDSTIIHTLAEVIKARADASVRHLERERLRSEAFSVLRSIPNTSSSARYAAVTTLKLHVDRVRDVMEDEAANDKDIEAVIRETERTFEVIKQRYPGDSYILSIESEYADLLDDHERSLSTLFAAREGNPRDPFIALRLAVMLVHRGDIKKAMDFVDEALSSNRGDKRLNFMYAELLRSSPGTSLADMLYYYKRAFTRWDENYESQFWYARFAFESDESELFRESKEIFRHLRSVPMSYEQRLKVKDVSGCANSPTEYTGAIMRVESTHGFVTINSRSVSVFFHKNDIDDETWERLSSGVKVKFHIGFNLNGPITINLKCTS